MKKLMILVLAVTMFSCSDDDNDSYPFLTISNEICEISNKDISSVQLLNYEFYNLNIASGDEQTFVLDNGMPGGLDDILVKVRLSGMQIINLTANVDFINGVAVTLTATGCGAEGGDPYGLN